MPTRSTPDSAPGGEKPYLCLFGREYLKNSANVYAPSNGVWPTWRRFLRRHRFDPWPRTMMVVSPDLFALAKKWEIVPVRHDGFLSGVIADKMDDERADTLAHPLNRHRPRTFRTEWDELTHWFRERSRQERCNVPSASLGEGVR